MRMWGSTDASSRARQNRRSASANRSNTWTISIRIFKESNANRDICHPLPPDNRPRGELVPEEEAPEVTICKISSSILEPGMLRLFISVKRATASRD